MKDHHYLWTFLVFERANYLHRQRYPKKHLQTQSALSETCYESYRCGTIKGDFQTLLHSAEANGSHFDR